MSDVSRCKFAAFRRGTRGKVVIRGTVQRPDVDPDAEPYLVRIPEARWDMRAFRLCWRKVHRRVSTFGPVEFDHIEPEIPETVRQLKILLPDGSTYWIDSKQPRR